MTRRRKSADRVPEAAERVCEFAAAAMFVLDKATDEEKAGNVSEETQNEFHEVSLEYYKRIVQLLTAYAAPENWQSGGYPINPFPQEIASSLAHELHDLTANSPSPMLRTLLRPHAPRESWRGEKAKRIAVAYIKEVATNGRIKDRSPTQTVAECFGVSKRAVQKWKTKYPDATAESLYPGRLTPQARAEMVEQEMRDEACLYREVGRGADGVRNRNLKNRRVRT